MNNRRIYIVVLNWNGTDDTIACLKSLFKIDYNNYQIILTDNCSENNNFCELKEWCKSNFNVCAEYNQTEALSGGKEDIERTLRNTNSNEKILIIRNEDNLGFAAGNNIALRYVLSKKNDNCFTLLLNNDTIVEPDFLTHLVCFMNTHKSYVACTPQIRLYEPNNQIWNCGGRITWFGNRRYYYANKDKSQVPQNGYRDIGFITGCAIFFKPNITGILSEKFFFGEEDFEFSLRMRKLGLKISCVFDSVIYHKVGKTIQKNNQNKILNRAFIFYASRLIDHKDYYTYIRLFLNRCINLCYLQLLLIIRFNLSIIRSMRFIIKLRNYVKNNDDLNKKKFYELMNLKLK